jgi:hypothetical protein
MAHGWPTDLGSPMRFSADSKAPAMLGEVTRFISPEMIRDHMLVRSGVPDRERDVHAGALA